MRAWLPVLLLILLGGVPGVRADAVTDVADGLDIDAPAGLCPFDGVIEGAEVDPALRQLVLGHQEVLAAFEPCSESDWPVGSAVSIGLLAEGDQIRRLSVTREQYLARLGRRHGPADWESLRATLDDPDNGIVDGMVSAGIVHQDRDAVHFGFILTRDSRNEADWRVLILGNSLVDGYPLLVSSVAPYGDADAFRAQIARQVAFTAGMVESNTTSRDMGAFDWMPWVKYGAVILVVLGGAAVSWDWCRKRRRVRDLDSEPEYEDENDKA